MADRGDKAFQEFLSEAQEIVEALSRDLGLMDAQRQGGQRDPELVNSAFRAVHSLKGISGLFGLTTMSHMAHTLETLLDRLRLGKLEFSAKVLDLLFEAVELFGKQVEELSAGRELDPARVSEYLRRLEADTSEHGPSSAAGANLGGFLLDPSILGVLTEYEEHRLRESIKAGRGLYRVRVAFDLMAIESGLESLKSRLKSVGEVLSYLPSAEMRSDNLIELDVLVASAEGLKAVVEATQPLGASIEAVPRGPEPPQPPPPPPKARAGRYTRPPAEPPAPAPPPVPPAPAPAPSKPAVRTDDDGEAERSASDSPSLRSVTQTVRVDIRRLDHLMNVVGELSLARAGITRILEELRAQPGTADLAQRLHREVRSLERRIDELQGGILEVRMVPLGQVFDKLGRVVRKISRDAGKEVSLTISGSETELDKLIVEELSDPLMHIIRNSIDHGIEDAETRRRVGKSEAGHISVSAGQKGNHVVIVVADDGGGFDEEKILEKAVEKGLIDPGTATELSRRDLLNLVFLPGFSTRTGVTELSGRGVGMDVVKTNIARLSGLIDVRSRRGHGTEIAITLPITLAIIQALVIKTAGRTYALPLGSVLESLTVEPADIGTIEGREVIGLRGQTLALVRLDEFFALRREPEQVQRAGRRYVVVVGLAQHRVGLVVDELVGQEDVVVKSLGRALSAVPGISGATELGGHETVLVLDVAAIVEEALHVSAAEAA
jgi:two-component system, chemotaxis family, sensor kinase CheA